MVGVRACVHKSALVRSNAEETSRGALGGWRLSCPTCSPELDSADFVFSVASAMVARSVAEHKNTFHTGSLLLARIGEHVGSGRGSFA